MSAANKIDFGRAPYEISKQGEYFLVRLHGELGAELAKDFEKKISGQIESVDQDCVIDASSLVEVHPTWTRSLMAIAKHVKTIKKQVRVVGASDAIHQWLVAQGLSSALPCVADLETALKQFKPQPQTPAQAKPRFDAQLMNIFLSASRDVIEMQVQTAVKPGTPFVREPRDSMGGDISGVIGLTGEQMNGTVVITFPETTFLSLMSKMLGEEFKELNPDLHDGAAEITNMIFGKAKVELNEKGYGFKMAIPSVVTGKNHSIQNKSTGPRVAIPFESGVGPFTVEVSFSS